ncbi:MAG: hypothetical protein QME51_06025, partial [Planctomycetota bacterium]|nr:hypothetical protein [Planctomycetota bacterium]
MRFVCFIFLLCVLCVSAVSVGYAESGLSIDSSAEMTLESTAAITVTGNITGTGTLTLASSGSVYLSGVWAINTFSAGNSTVYFISEGASTAEMVCSTTNRTFYNLVIDGLTLVSSSSTAGLSVSQSLTVTDYGTLNLGEGLVHNVGLPITISGILDLGLSELQSGGNLTVASGGVLVLNGTSDSFRPQLTMGNGYALTIQGKMTTTWSGGSNLKPLITSGGTYNCTVSGRLDLDGLIFEKADGSGLTISNTADKDNIDLDNVVFQNVAAGGRHLYIGFTSGNYVGCFDGCTFDYSFGSGGNNVVCANTDGSTLLYFTSWSGSGSGPAYDSKGTNTQIIWVVADSIKALSPAAIILESNSAITVPGDFNIEIVTCVGSANIHLAGAWGVVTFTPDTSTVYLDGGYQNLSSEDFYNLVVRSGDARTYSSATVGIGSGGTLTVTAKTASQTGKYTIDGGTIRLGNNANIDVASTGCFKARNSAKMTTPNPGTERFSFSVKGILDLSDCFITSTTASGLAITSTATIVNLDKTRFYDHPGSGGSFLSIAKDSADKDFYGCWFATIPSGGYNVSATGSGSIFRLELANAGPGAGETKDYDDDPDDDGVANTGGAVVLWIERAITETASSGGIVGFLTAAFDLDTYAYYATYGVSKDINGSGTSDRIFALNGSGQVMFYYDVRQWYGDVVDQVWWWSETGQRTVY